jgi:hypothetical protein
MNQKTVKTRRIDIEKELKSLGRQEITVPKGLSQTTYETIKEKHDDADRAIPWVMAFIIAFNFLITVAAIIGIGFGLSLNIYQWLIVLSSTIAVNTIILIVTIIFKDDIIKQISRLT